MNKRILGAYNPVMRRVKVNFSKREFDEALKGNPDYYYVFSTIFHENIHNLQFIGTTIGRYISNLMIKIGTFGFKSIKKNVKNNRFDKLRRPLAYNFLLDIEFNNQLSIEELFFNNHINLYFAIVGVLPNESINKTIFDYLNFEIDTEVLVPSFMHKNKNYLLGLNTILESFASINERIHIYEFFRHDEEKYLDAFKKIEFNPYYLIETYIENELPKLMNYQLACVIIDIALNPVTNLVNYKLKWSDFHPGWRLKRIVQYLKKCNLNISDFDSFEALIGLKENILKHFNWDDPWNDIRLIDLEAANFYIDKIIKYRKEIPELFFLPYYHTDILIKEFGVYQDDIVMHNEFDDNLFNINIDNVESQVGVVGYLLYIAVMEQFFNLYLSDKLICPYHGVEFPENTSCIDGCLFESWFNTLIGFPLKEYGKIPRDTSYFYK